MMPASEKLSVQEIFQEIMAKAKRLLFAIAACLRSFACALSLTLVASSYLNSFTETFQPVHQ